MIRENSPELKMIFKINNNKNIIIETFIDKKITDNIKTEGCISEYKFIISYLKDGQQEEFIIEKLDNTFKISGSSIENLNPFAKKMDILKFQNIIPEKTP